MLLMWRGLLLVMLLLVFVMLWMFVMLRMFVLRWKLQRRGLGRVVSLRSLGDNMQSLIMWPPMWDHMMRIRRPWGRVGVMGNMCHVRRMRVVVCWDLR